MQARIGESRRAAEDDSILGTMHRLVAITKEPDDVARAARCSYFGGWAFYTSLSMHTAEYYELELATLLSATGERIRHPELGIVRTWKRLKRVSVYFIRRLFRTSRRIF